MPDRRYPSSRPPRRCGAGRIPELSGGNGRLVMIQSPARTPRPGWVKNMMAGLLNCGSRLPRTFPGIWPIGSLRGRLPPTVAGAVAELAPEWHRTAFPFDPSDLQAVGSHPVLSSIAIHHGQGRLVTAPSHRGRPLRGRTFPGRRMRSARLAQRDGSSLSPCGLQRRQGGPSRQQGSGQEEDRAKGQAEDQQVGPGQRQISE